MRYTIEIQYQTGNSFGSEETSGELGISWESLDKAKEGLQRIAAIEKLESRFSYIMSEAEKDVEREKLVGYTKHPKWGSWGLTLQLDDGTEQPVSMFWQGYFERFRSAEIVPVDRSNTDMKFTL
jgi:hypothetical protein